MSNDTAAQSTQSLESLGPVHEDDYVVLLYYAYCNIPCTSDAVAKEEQVCKHLDLLGRVRVSPEGINATLGGIWTNIQAYTQHATRTYGRGIDFKYSRGDCSVFTELAVKETLEVVTLNVPGVVASAQAGGRHLSPTEFHGAMVQAAQGDKETILLDTRNLYESQVGVFVAPGCRTVLTGTVNPLNHSMRNIDTDVTHDTRTHRPCLVMFGLSIQRQFSDFPKFLQEHNDVLKNKRILMYCTGGVRCERASALVRSMGEGFDDVAQLSGGVHRYLETYPAETGGRFIGKNFVFDGRVAQPEPESRSSASSVVSVTGQLGEAQATSVTAGALQSVSEKLAASDAGVAGAGVDNDLHAQVDDLGSLGTCQSCGSSHGNFKASTRCKSCRMLVLLCPKCDKARVPIQCHLCDDRFSTGGGSRILRYAVCDNVDRVGSNGGDGGGDGDGGATLDHCEGALQMETSVTFFTERLAAAKRPAIRIACLRCDKSAGVSGNASVQAKLNATGSIDNIDDSKLYDSLLSAIAGTENAVIEFVGIDVSLDDGDGNLIGSLRKRIENTEPRVYGVLGCGKMGALAIQVANALTRRGEPSEVGDAFARCVFAVCVCCSDTDTPVTGTRQTPSVEGDMDGSTRSDADIGSAPILLIDTIDAVADMPATFGTLERIGDVTACQIAPKGTCQRQMPGTKGIAKAIKTISSFAKRYAPVVMT